MSEKQTLFDALLRETEYLIETQQLSTDQEKLFFDKLDLIFSLIKIKLRQFDKEKKRFILKELYDIYKWQPEKCRWGYSQDIPEDIFVRFIAMAYDYDTREMDDISAIDEFSTLKQLFVLEGIAEKCSLYLTSDKKKNPLDNIHGIIDIRSFIFDNMKQASVEHYGVEAANMDEDSMMLGIAYAMWGSL